MKTLLSLHQMLLHVIVFLLHLVNKFFMHLDKMDNMYRRFETKGERSGLEGNEYGFDNMFNKMLDILEKLWYNSCIEYEAKLLDEDNE